jgi:hypothetical protein
VTRGTARTHRLAGQASIERAVELLLKAVHAGDDARKQARSAAQMLLSGVTELTRHTRVIISPDGALHQLPFELLETGVGRTLLDSHVVSYVPSGSVLAVLRDRKGAPAPARAALAISASPTTGGSTQSTNGEPLPGPIDRGVYDLDVSKLQPLPSANDEARSVAAALGEGRSIVLLGESATELDLKRQPLHDFRVVHFAVHGLISTRVPARSALLLRPAGAEDGILQAREILTLRLAADLVTLAEKRRIRVAGTINGHSLHATLVPTKAGTHRLYINGGMRAAAGVSVGDRVTLELRVLQFNDADLPEDLAHALTKASLRPRFDALSASHRRELLRSIEDARSETNRAARIERTLRHLRGESTQQAKSAAVDKPLWICPKCGHPFVTKNMNHSCARHELDEVFHGKPRHIRQLFDRFRALVHERGPTTMIVYRDRVAFMVKVRFGGATPKRNHLELGFWFTERDEDPRFSKIETIATNAHVHRAKIRALHELDDDVRQWIDRAYRVGCREHLR